MASNSVAVKRIYNPGWEKLPREEQAVLRERLRALCTKDTEKGIAEYLKLFEEIIPRIQSLIVEMLEREDKTSSKDATSKKDEKMSPKDVTAKMADYAKRLLEVDAILIEKLYIVQVASIEGWRFANDVDFYQSGASENSAYVKALEKRDKRRKTEGSHPYPYSRQGSYATGRGGGRSGRQRGGRSDHSWGSQQWGLQQSMMSQPFPLMPQFPTQSQHNYGFQSYQSNPYLAAPPPPPPPSANLSAAQRGRCLNCGSPSHFVKDCPTKPAYPISLSAPPRQ